MDNKELTQYGIFWVPDDPVVNNFITKWKERAHVLEPSAKYLQHPVHSTLFLFMGLPGDEGSLFEEIAGLCRNQKPIQIEFNGWHTFKNDIATGGDTLALSFVLSKSLLKLQEHVGTMAHQYSRGVLPYKIEWAGPFQKSFERYGFPFVGDHWIPHLTIASFSDRGKQLISASASSGDTPRVTFMNGLSIYRIYNDGHELTRTFEFVK
jgi:hypothetical protein